LTQQEASHCCGGGALAKPKSNHDWLVIQVPPKKPTFSKKENKADGPQHRSHSPSSSPFSSLPFSFTPLPSSPSPVGLRRYTQLEIKSFYRQSSFAFLSNTIFSWLPTIWYHEEEKEENEKNEEKEWL